MKNTKYNIYNVNDEKEHKIKKNEILTLYDEKKYWNHKDREWRSTHTDIIKVKVVDVIDSRTYKKSFKENKLSKIYYFDNHEFKNFKVDEQKELSDLANDFKKRKKLYTNKTLIKLLNSSINSDNYIKILNEVLRLKIK